MVRVAQRRIASVVLVMVITSFVVYSALYLSPGDPVNTLAGGRQLSPAARAELAHDYDLDKPYLERYGIWLGGVLHGDFGTSVVSQGQEVRDLIKPRLGTTALLVAMSALLTVGLGLIAGIVSGLSRGKIGTLVTTAAAIGLAVPSFVAAVFLIAVFAVGLGWFPVFGSGSGFVDQIWHLTLPAIALALSNLAYVARITETAIAKEAASEHVLTARSRGLPNALVIRRHILRNAAIPIVTSAGLVTAYLIVGAAVVETAFSVDGVGSYLVDAVARHDFAVVQALTLVVVLAFLTVNLAVDLLYARLDPRMRRE